MVKRICAVIVAWFALVSVAAFAEINAASSNHWHSHADSAMGTSITVEFWLEDSARAKDLIDGVMAEMRRVDQLMSPYIETSELSIVNRDAFTLPVKVSSELFSLLQLSLQHGKWSRGTFDITYASVGSQYNYREGIKPSELDIQQSLALIDYSSIVLDNSLQTVRYKVRGTKIDLGGIAKGHAVDRATRYLYQQGVRHATVSAGGDSSILGDRRGRPWMLGIKNPRGDGHLISLPLQDVSVSTSGDYERYFIDQSGERHHHIINPKNGKSATQLRSVTILGPNATMTDALSTTVFVMGIKRGLTYINGIENVSAILIDAEGKLHYSNDLVRPERIE